MAQNFVYSRSQTSQLGPLELRRTRGCHGSTTVSAKSITTARRQRGFNAGPRSNPHGDANKNSTKQYQLSAECFLYAGQGEKPRLSGTAEKKMTADF